MAIITVPKALREKLGEEGSEALIEMINHSQDNQKADMIQLVGEKFERRLSEEISGLKAELKTDIANSRTEMVRWMFMFWIGQVAALIGILFAFFR